MGSTLIFQFLYINLLNYSNFYLMFNVFEKIKNVGKIKKTFINVYYNYERQKNFRPFSVQL